KVAQEAGGENTLQAKIANLLSRQPALTGDEPTAATPLDTLVSGLVPGSKGDALKTLSAVKTQDDSKSELSEEELAGLSALMAMLPHQQTATPVASGTTGNGLTAKSTLNAAALSQNGAGQQSMSTLLAGHEKAQQASTYQAQAQNADPSQPVNAPATPIVAAAAEKQDLASSPSSTAPTATLAPVISSNVTSHAAATVATAPVLSQPLGTQ